MDDIDSEIISALTSDGRITFSELSQRIGLSGPSTAERVRRLEAEGVICGYTAQVDPASVGAGLGAYVMVTLDAPSVRAPFLQAMHALDPVLEVHHIAGDADYLLKVRCADTAALESLISEGIKSVAGVGRTVTTIVLSTAFERPVGSSHR